MSTTSHDQEKTAVPITGVEGTAMSLGSSGPERYA